MDRRKLFKLFKWFSLIFIGLVMLITVLVSFFKDDIISIVIKEVNAHLKAKVSVEKVEIAFWRSFPNLSVDFNKVFIQDTYDNATEKDTLFYSEKIRLKFNPLDIWREQYQLKKMDIYPGTLQLKVNEHGENNYDILKESKDTTDTSFDFDLKKVNIQDLRFSYTNKQINHRYATDLIDTELKGAFAEKVFSIHAKSTQMVRETRSGKVNFVKDKKAELDINIEIDQNKGTLLIPKTLISIANLPFEFTGYLGPDKMKFIVEAKKLSLTEVAKNFTMDEVQQVNYYSGSGNVDFLLRIEDNYDDDKMMLLDCKFGVLNGKLVEPQNNISVSNLSLVGFYTNHESKGKDELILDKINFQTTAGTFDGKVAISEFDSPKMFGYAKGFLNLTMLHSFFSIPLIDSLGGNLMVNSDFDIKLISDNQIDVKQCEGSLEFLNVFFKLNNDHRLFHSINGISKLNKNEVLVNGLSIMVGKSDLLLNGLFSNIYNFFKSEGKLKTKIDIVSNVIDLQDFAIESKKEKQELNTPRSFVLPESIDGQLNLMVGKLNYEQHFFEQIKGDLTLNNRVFNFSNLHFKTSGANVHGDLQIVESSEEYFNVVSNLTSKNIQLKQLMKDWNNFQQDVITDKHIFGQAAANLYLEAPFDLRKGIEMKSIKSDLNIKIINGSLYKVEAFAEMIESMKTPSAKLVLGADNIKDFGGKLSDLKFATLENTLVIREGIITIPKMLIESSALTIETRGTHAFSNEIDYRFSFRLRDLKNKKTSEFGDEIDDKTGMLIYLRMNGNLDNPKFAWDKESKAADRKEYNEQEKQTMKSMLKSDLGLFKKDSTVQQYENVKKNKEILEVQYGEDTKIEENFEKEKKKREGKIGGFIKKMEQEEKNRKRVGVEID